MFIPTRDECYELANNSDVFYVTKTIVNGCEVELYDYRLATYKDFKENNAHNMRGIAFVNQNNTWIPYPALHKFFNVNENEDWEASKLRSKKIINVQDKRDGSMISFCKCAGEVFAKSKMSFVSEQAKTAQQIYDNDERVYNFVNWCLSFDLYPIFELTSPFNQIVLNYCDTKLSLLQLRDKNGEYLPAESLINCHKHFGVELAEIQEILDLDDYLQMREYVTGIEGWVITFDDGTIAKVKTKEYLDKHGVFSELREDNIIRLCVEETIDDVISELNGQKKEFVQNVNDIVTKKFNSLVLEYKDLRYKYFNVFNENRKDFAMMYKNERMFPQLMRTLNTSFRDVEQTAKQCAKEYILSHATSLTKAKEFLV